MNEIVRTPEVIAAEINVIKAQTREVVKAARMMADKVETGV